MYTDYSQCFRYKKSLIYLLLTGVLVFCGLQAVKAQSDYIPSGDKQYQLIDRLKIKLRHDPILGFTTLKYLNRQDITQQIEVIDSLDRAGALGDLLTPVDRYNIHCLLMNNSDVSASHRDSFWVKKPLFNFLFPSSTAHIYHKEQPGFTIVADPVVNFQQGHSSDGQRLFNNTRGIRIRGQVDERLGFYTYLSDNQERDPLYVQQQAYLYRNKNIIALPGVGNFKSFANHAGAFDYFYILGGLTFNAGNNWDFQLAYDKFKIGEGLRSLFMGEDGAPYFFLRANGRLGKNVHLSSVIAQTIAPFSSTGGYLGVDSTRPRSYMMFHYLDWQLTPSLKLGLFENTLFNGSTGKNGGRPAIWNDNPEDGPVSTPEKGTTTRTRVGIDARLIAVKNLEIYGQWMIDGLTKIGSKDFKNRNAFQLGAKYVDVLGVKNLDLQVETNSSRPYAYTASYMENNYTNYNMPLAHPLGANFREYLALASYQPLKKWYVNAQVMAYRKGLDENGYNYGGNLLYPYSYNRPADDLSIGSGNKATVSLYSLGIAFELLQNLYIEANGGLRNYKTLNEGKNNINFFTVGVRWNIARRVFDF